MQISVSNAVLENFIFFGFFIAIILGSKVWTKNRPELVPISITNELKGFAILLVIFAHVGLYLSTNSKYLAPLSYFGGVGVNIFLFLSGFGLTLSSLNKESTRREFYIKRILKIFIPLWLVLGLLVCLDFIIHHKVYDAVVLQHAVVGFFPEANLYTNINSPLWYFSFILFYYLLFPLLWIKKMPYVTAFLLFIISYLVLTRVQLPVTQGVLSLYKVHVLALPLGIIGGWIIFRWGDVFKRILQKSFYPTQQKFWLISLRWAIIGALVGIIYYLGINSGVGKSLRAEQIIAVYTTLAIITVFIIKYTRFKILELWGVYSYEIYLLHWPLMYRFDLLYKILPPSLATVIYLFIFIGLGFVLQRLSWWSEKNIFRFMTRSA